MDPPRVDLLSQRLFGPLVAGSNPRHFARASGAQPTACPVPPQLSTPWRRSGKKFLLSPTGAKVDSLRRAETSDWR